MGIRNYFLQRQAEMDSKINNQTMGGVSRNTSRVINPPGGRSNMSDIFGGGEVGAQQNQKPIEKRPEKLAEKQVTFSEDNKTETKEVQNCETQTDAGQNSRDDAAKYIEILRPQFNGNAFSTDYNHTALISVFLLKIFVD